MFCITQLILENFYITQKYSFHLTFFLFTHVLRSGILYICIQTQTYTYLNRKEESKIGERMEKERRWSVKLPMEPACRCSFSPLLHTYNPLPLAKAQCRR